MLFSNKDVAVLDLTHGGIPLARSIAHQANRVTAIDVYGTIDKEVLLDLEKDEIIIKDNLNNIDPDLVVAPVHMDPALMPDLLSCPVITHHMAVGELLLNGIKGSGIIEITGTGAKTSSAVLLADMASRSMSVVSHTTHGVEHWSNGVPKMVYQGLSIAPGSILEALEHTLNINPDLYIFEISLGGTGAADIGIITTLENEYAIANGTTTSTAAKNQMVGYSRKGSTLIVNALSVNALSKDTIDARDSVRTVTFSDTSKEADVYLEDPGTGVRSIHYSGMDISFTPGTGYDPSAYSTAIACTAAAATVLGIEPDTIRSSLQAFQGVDGRMRLKELQGRTIVDNSNSGMNIRSVEQALDYSKKFTSKSSRLLLVLGEEAQQVCEGLDPEDVSVFITDHVSEVDNIFLVGERMQIIKGNKISHFSSLETAIENARAKTSKNDIIISCVKCFR
ncbi:MAG: coenzyme F430 synthase [Methanosarcinales archaeon]|nr:coenzyme F430 synthase [Methanosarcinales archaeon]